MTGPRLAVVQQAFQSIDNHNLGQVHVEAVLKSFCAQGHPAVIDGRHSA